MKTDFYAYIHCKPDGIPFYVGKGGARRVSELTRNNRHHRNTIKKYGAENILVGKLACSSEAIAFELEKGMIKCLRRMGVTLCNMTDGGEGPAGRKMSPEQLEAHAAARRGKKQQLAHIEARKKGLVLALATGEMRARLSAATKKTWADPVVRGRRTAGLAKSWENNEARKAETSKTQTLVGNTEEARAERKARLEAQWADPHKRSERLAKMQEALAKPEELARKAVATKAAWSDPDARARRIAAIKLARSTPESRERTAIASRLAAANRKASKR